MDFPKEDIIKYCKLNIADCIILEVRLRLMRKKIVDNETTFVPTGTICLSFSGVNTPREAMICSLLFSVFPYLMTVLQCYNCLGYGQTQKICKGKIRCKECG